MVEKSELPINMRILVETIGFIGDNIFASSVAKKLKDQYANCTVDMNLSVVHPYELLCMNPYIDNVYLEPTKKIYDKIFKLRPINRKTTPCEQFQQQCGILNPSKEFEVFTNKQIDAYVNYMFSDFRDKKIIAWLSNWEERSFLFSEDQYKRGIDVPNLGYGGKHRDIPSIIKSLNANDDIILIEVGKPPGTSQLDIDLNTVTEYTLTASILKNCDYFIGSEGGLCNLAAGVGTKTIITGDFVHQLYGWNGVLEKCDNPKLGPEYYFESGHVSLNPYLTDDEVYVEILKIIR